MTDLENLLVSTYRAHENDAKFAQDVGAAVEARRSSRRGYADRLAPALAVGVVVIVIAVVAIVVGSRDRSDSALSGITHTFVYGAQTDSPLTLRPPGAHGPTTVSESTARREIGNPFAGPQLDGLVQFGLARVTATDGVAMQSSRFTLDNTLAWVGVSRIDTADNSSSCPAEPQSISRSHLPPVFKHYYFAVIVNAATGAVATWNEDESGLILRECEQSSG